MLTVGTGVKPTTSEEKPIVKQRLKERAKSMAADIYTGGFIAATSMLPMARVVGMPMGICKAITGVGQLKEGMKAQDKHEVWDGALNTMLGLSLVAASTFAFLPSLSFAVVGGSMLLGKIIYDHPTDLLFTETKNLAVDTAYVIGQGAKSVGKAIWHGIKKPFTG